MLGLPRLDLEQSRHVHAHAVTLSGLSVLSARVAGVAPVVMRTVPHRYMVLSLQLGEALGSYEGDAPCWHTGALSGLRSGPVTYGSVAQLAASVGITRRQLERDCARWIGESPHQLLMQSRARRVLVALQTHAALASIAVGAGYADQAHMTRALRQLTLRTPRQWARGELSQHGKTYLQTSGELITW